MANLEGIRGRFGFYLPPSMEDLGLYELEHNPKNTYIVSLLKIRLIPGKL